jgi:hypothetical protein
MTVDNEYSRYLVFYFDFIEVFTCFCSDRKFDNSWFILCLFHESCENNFLLYNINVYMCWLRINKKIIKSDIKDLNTKNSEPKQ